MTLLLVIILLLVFLSIIVFTVSQKIKLKFDMYNTEINFALFWLEPFLGVFISIENNIPVLSIHIFNKKILRKQINRNNTSNKKYNILEITQPREVEINTVYGFTDPFITGLTCGAINIASTFIPVSNLIQSPDFISGDDYIHMDASAKVNLGTILINYFKQKSK